MTVKETPQKVITKTLSFFRTGWQHGGQINYTINEDTPSSISVSTTRSMLPHTVIGWAFNLFMTLITLGGWLIVWFIWAIATEGNTINIVELVAYPEESGTEVDVTSNNAQWRRDVEEWLESTFT